MACNFHAAMNQATIHSLTLSLALLVGGVHAQTTTSDNDQPTQVEADALRYDENKRLSVFTGNVKLTRGSLVIRGERLELQEDEQGEQQGVATGAPARFERDRPGTNERIQGTAQRITYNSRSAVLVLDGDAVLRRLRDGKLADETRGARIDYTDSTGIFNVRGNPATGGSGRVTAVIGPKPASSGP